jgi:hypothetical protein
MWGIFEHNSSIIRPHVYEERLKMFSTAKSVDHRCESHKRGFFMHLLPQQSDPTFAKKPIVETQTARTPCTKQTHI